MTANILNFVGREPAWHRLGTIIPRDEPLSLSDALTLAGADYQVKTTKLTTEAFGARIDTGRVAIVRQPIAADPQPRMLGVASAKYKPVQNADLAAALAPIIEANGWPVETVGVLGQGEKVFFTLEAGESEVPGDTSPVQVFFLISGGHNGGTAVNVAVTPVRVVCQNTLVLGLSEATISAAVMHVGNAVGEVQFVANTVARMQAAKASVADAMRLLAKRELPADLIADVIETAYTFDRDTRSVAQARAFLDGTVELTEERRKALEGKVSKRDGWIESVKAWKSAASDRLAVFNDEFPGVANTPWAAYNAVVEVEQYRRGKSATTVARDLLFSGQRGQIVARAYDRAMELAIS